jgi:hypothetical protein
MGLQEELWGFDAIYIVPAAKNLLVTKKHPEIKSDSSDREWKEINYRGELKPEAIRVTLHNTGVLNTKRNSTTQMEFQLHCKIANEQRIKFRWIQEFIVEF